MPVKTMVCVTVPVSKLDHFAWAWCKYHYAGY